MAINCNQVCGQQQNKESFFSQLTFRFYRQKAKQDMERNQKTTACLTWLAWKRGQNIRGGGGGKAETQQDKQPGINIPGAERMCLGGSSWWCYQGMVINQDGGVINPWRWEGFREVLSEHTQRSHQDWAPLTHSQGEPDPRQIGEEFLLKSHEWAKISWKPMERAVTNQHKSIKVTTQQERSGKWIPGLTGDGWKWKANTPTISISTGCCGTDS